MRNSHEPEHRRYLESKDTIKQIERLYSGKIKKLGIKTSNVLNEYIHGKIKVK